MSVTSSYRGQEKKKIGWLRHVLTGLSVLIFVAGVAMLGYMAWVLATSVTVTRFLSGTLVFTYSAVSVGFVLFLTGLVGWVAGASELTCVLKTYFIALVMAMLAEVAGIVALNILGTKMEDILVNGWAEVNQGTRNIIQGSLDCCGFYGPREFAYTSYPIDDSCYEQNMEADEPSVAPLTLKQSGCGPLLQRWFTTNRAVWCSLLAGVGGLQLMSAILCLHIIRKLRDKTNRGTNSLRKLAEAHQINYAYSL